jgi:curved DNA-binding protein CbpA
LIRQQDYYAILGVSKTATDSQIKKAYRKRAVQTHPDKTGGDRRAFDRVSEAYTILSDDAKRTIYDRYWEEGVGTTNNRSDSSRARSGRLVSTLFRSRPTSSSQSDCPVSTGGVAGRFVSGYALRSILVRTTSGS